MRVSVFYHSWGEVRLNPLGMFASSGPMHQPWLMMMMMMMSIEKLVERELAGETKVLRENLPTMPLCATQIPHDLT
jgi:hypothetical protein